MYSSEPPGACSCERHWQPRTAIPPTWLPKLRQDLLKRGVPDSLVSRLSGPVMCAMLCVLRRWQHCGDPARHAPILLSETTYLENLHRCYDLVRHVIPSVPDPEVCHVGEAARAALLHLTHLLESGIPPVSDDLKADLIKVWSCQPHDPVFHCNNFGALFLW